MTLVHLDHLTLARDLAAQPQDWPVPPRFDPQRRWYHRLPTAPGTEAWLLTWLPGQGTELHDHGGSSGAFVVVSGILTEDTVDGAARLHAQTVRAGAGRRFGPHHVHRITNNGTSPAVSLHVYGPALGSMTRYALTDGRLTIAAVERTGDNW
jgi:mannose-6-phosphate isomerase-like protein (cupin superfamily)